MDRDLEQVVILDTQNLKVGIFVHCFHFEIS